MEYVTFAEISPRDFLPLLNKQKIRTHLMEHDVFDEETARAWMESKIAMDAVPGCRVRAVMEEGQLCGWCGIQLEEGQYEIAIVLDDRYWGMGRSIFRDMMAWAKEFGHEVVLIHFLHTRPAYRFLKKISRNSYENELFGNKFTTYELVVS